MVVQVHATSEASWAMSTKIHSSDISSLLATPICDLSLTIAGSRLEPLIANFKKELTKAGIVQLEPSFYLSTEWGVPFGAVSISIPFYLARKDLIALHAEQTGFLEGAGRKDFLRYLRHEMGHVVNYAYRLHDRADWTKYFGSIQDEYVEEYRPHPFSREYVCHLPGWYAQKHPDEDWAECFAVWMTPRFDWRTAYAAWPVALGKLEFCDRLMQEINQRAPDSAVVDTEENVSELKYTLQHFYTAVYNQEENEQVEASGAESLELQPALDAPLQGIFEDMGDREDLSTTAPRLPAGALIRRVAHDLVYNVYRWTGCFPDRVRPLVQQLAERADSLKQVYPADHETEAIMAISTLVTALAMDNVVRRPPRQRVQCKVSQGASAPVTE